VTPRGGGNRIYPKTPPFPPISSMPYLGPHRLPQWERKESPVVGTDLLGELFVPLGAI
jgi:hypothetical protein